MPTIVLACPKGGSGKSTSSLVLATQLALNGADVTLIDADPNKPQSRWARLPGKPDNLTIVVSTSETTIIDDIESAEQSTPFVIVDLEGTASLLVAYAISRADLVIIPTQGSQLDATEAAKAVTLIKQQEKMISKSIPHRILFTRTSPAIKPRTLAHIQEQFRKFNVASLQIHLHEREAFRAIWSFGGTLNSLDPKHVGNIDSAKANARALAAEVVKVLQQLESNKPSSQEKQHEVTV